MRYHSVVIEVEVTVGSSGQCGLTPLGCHPFQASTFAGNRLVIVIVELPDHILGFDAAKEHLTLLVDRYHGSAGAATLAVGLRVWAKDATPRVWNPNTTSFGPWAIA